MQAAAVQACWPLRQPGTEQAPGPGVAAVPAVPAVPDSGGNAVVVVEADAAGILTLTAGQGLGQGLGQSGHLQAPEKPPSKVAASMPNRGWFMGRSPSLFGG